MSADLFRELELLEKEKGINKDVIIEAIEAALISAYKKNFGSSQNVRVNFDKDTGTFKVYTLKTVAEIPQNDFLEISLEKAKEIDGQLGVGDVAEIEVTPRTFGRISAQTAKQVVVQRLRDAERGLIFEEFANKEGEIVSGIIQRNERKNVVIAFEKTEGILAPSEQTEGERYNFNDRIKTYVIDVKRTTKGPQIMLSRTHPGLVKRLFELEVPEIQEGVVEIKSLTREAGSRTKIAVYSKDENIDPVGACVGQKGSRVQAIVDELRGEKIDIIKWSSDPKEYISASLSPSKVVRVEVNEDEKSAKVTVPDFQLSLAIGKEGQNARLAAKLTGWKVDIKSESQLRTEIEKQLLNYEGDAQKVYGKEPLYTESDLFNTNSDLFNPEQNHDEECQDDGQKYEYKNKDDILDQLFFDMTKSKQDVNEEVVDEEDVNEEDINEDEEKEE